MEFVYVVPREKLFPECYPHGLVPFEDDDDRAAFEARIRDEGFFCERAYAERMPSLQQIIPYTLFHTGGEILLMRRLAAGGEVRLHDKLSIGVGGHINPEDLTASESADPLTAGTQREIAEETVVRGSYSLHAVGFLNDDSTPVGAVHVGVVQVAEVNGTVEIREKDVLEGTLVTPAELTQRRNQGANFETWSSFLIDRLDELLPSPDPVSA